MTKPWRVQPKHIDPVGDPLLVLGWWARVAVRKLEVIPGVLGEFWGVRLGACRTSAGLKASGWKSKPRKGIFFGAMRFFLRWGLGHIRIMKGDIHSIQQVATWLMRALSQLSEFLGVAP